jgi:Proton-conducting membrane transporter
VPPGGTGAGHDPGFEAGRRLANWQHPQQFLLGVGEVPDVLPAGAAPAYERDRTSASPVPGLLFKAGGVPAHFWVPDVTDGTSAPVAAFVTTVPKIGAFAALLRLLTTAIPPATVDWPLLAVGLGHRTVRRRHCRLAVARRRAGTPDPRRPPHRRHVRPRRRAAGSAR